MHAGLPLAQVGRVAEVAAATTARVKRFCVAYLLRLVVLQK